MSDKMPRTRVMVIGLDMGDGELIRHWMRQGRLPHFAALTSSGAWFELESTAEVLHTSTWPTFATGTLPGRHGVYYPYQPKPGHQLASHIRSDHYGAPTLWRLADAEGRRCVVYDVPETFPEREFGGLAVFDWGTWAWYGKPSAQPPYLLKELKSRFGRYPLGFEAKRLGLRYPYGLDQRLVASVEYKCLTAQWLFERSPWDLAVVGFCETHPAGHYLWPADVYNVGTADEAVFEPLLQVYAAVDAALGALCANLSSDVAVMVVSGDGVRPNRCGWHLLPAVLERLEYTASRRPPSVPKSGPQPGHAGRGRPSFAAEARRWISATLPWRIRDRLGVWVQTAAIDWSRTRAFTLPTDLEGCIRLNVKGREPHGVVEPGAQYTDVCHEIRTRLEELINPATDARAVRRVWLRNEVFPGPRQEDLPDLVVTWNDEAPLEALRSPRFGRIEGVNPDPRPGTHSPYGFLLAKTPGIRTGLVSRARLTDVAATVLELLRVRQVDRLDGRPVDALTEAAPLRA